MPVKDTVRDTLARFNGSSTPDDSGYSAWVLRQVKELQKSGAGQQIIVGGASGWIAGYVSARFGKAAATALGGTLILVQLGNQYGYIKIDWKKIDQEAKAVKKEIGKRAEKDLPQIREQVTTFVKENITLVTSFAGGFLIGLSSA